jgi:hypothetical protein
MNAANTSPEPRNPRPRMWPMVTGGNVSTLGTIRPNPLLPPVHSGGTWVLGRFLALFHGCMVNKGTTAVSCYAYAQVH